MEVLSFLRNLFAFSIICSLSNTSLHFLPNNRVDSNDLRLISLAFNVSKLTVALSNRRSLIIVNLRKDLVIDTLIQNLHRNTIQITSFTDHKALMKLTVSSEQKNALFFVNDCDDILSLVFNSMKTPKTTQEHFNFTENVIPNNNDTLSLSKSDVAIPERSPIYCVQDDADVDGIVKSQVSNCQFHLTSEELEPGSILSDRVLDHTHNLHNHTLWNFRNHLVFMVKERREGQLKDGRHQNQPVNEIAFLNIAQDYQEGKSLIPYFKFFWRFFRGQRTIICRVLCFWYDPYAEKLHYYSSSEDKHYFDFSLKNFHRKYIRILLRTDILLDFEILQPWNFWFIIFSNFLEHLGNSLNSTNMIETLTPPSTALTVKITEDGAGLKHDNDIIVYNVGTVLGVADFADFSYTATLDFFSLTILAPRRGFMPQFLTAFKSFTPTVWWATFTTIGVFIIMLAVFQHSQWGIFAALYSETEIRTYENTSPFLTVYAYFLCGSPPTLLLGRLISGKMLFVIFSFSALIIGTAFQGAMVTLINLGVHNPDIETLDDLKESNNFIQTGNPTSSAVFFR
ncbi:unnamed protein product [Bemisia tabaci]|uniref:Ionotropic receptor n=1 Tax=Bemisia tabaci TaxID=7038 RepID=A0A9P0FA11_BEMTA|nr:unnamed protein product [Bemisia tabaci]